MQVEYRVRAVTRYVVTRFDEHEGDQRTPSIETFGEFPNRKQADFVGRAMHVAETGSTFATIVDAPEPCGTFYATSHAQCSALMDFIHSDAFPPA